MSYLATIDAGACAAHGDCEAIAPEVFAIEDVAVVVGTGPGELMLAAAQACPSVAIVITDADSGRQVFP
jgi:ferredoxin